jgi:hypothetical protein
MTNAVLKAALDEAQGKPGEGGFVDLPEGRRITLHAAHGGVGLTVTKIERIAHEGGMVRARNERGEMFVLRLEDIFAVSIEGNRSGASGSPRKAGFLG